MKIAIIWHRFYFNGRPMMGLCGIVDDTKLTDTNGLFITEDRLWFLLTQDGSFNCYKLTETELSGLVLERKYHEATVGGFINHDSTYSQSKKGEIPEELSSHNDKNFENLEFSKGTSLVYNAPLSLTEDKLVFRFEPSDIINPNPGMIN